MFENNDWNISQDDVNDLFAEDMNKSKTDESNKIEIQKSCTNISRFEFNQNVYKTTENATSSQPTISQKRVVLDIFEKDNNQRNASISNDVSHSLYNDSVQTITKHENQKNLVLAIFQQNEFDEKKKSITSNFKPTVKSVLKIPETVLDTVNELKRKKNVAFSESVQETNCIKKICTVNIDKSAKNSKVDNLNQFNDLESSANHYSIVKKDVINTRKEKLLNLLKNPIRKTTNIPQAVIRKFPGPAGLLPDDVDETEIINLDSVDENKNNKSNRYTDICSQNTKNLFSTGAWQLMIDDLPANFNLYDIAAIKENALEYSRTYRKVPYLAGIVQYIDYKPNDPHVILKDFTGKIDARIHHSICKLYPNALGTGVVILIKDVGLIVTSKKYVCLIVSLKNLVSVYSDDVRLVETNYLQELLDSNYSCKLFKSQENILDEDVEKQTINQKTNIPIFENNLSEIQLSKNDLNMNSHNKNDQVGSREIFSSDRSNMPKQCEVIHNTANELEFDCSEDDSWLAVNINDLSSSQCHQFPSSTPMEIDTENTEKEIFDDRKHNESISKTLMKYAWQKKTKPSLNPNLVTNNLSISSDNIFKDALLNKNLVSQINENSDNNLKTEMKVNQHVLHSESLSNSTKTKLAQFRSKYDLTQELIIPKNNENLDQLDKIEKCGKENVENETLTKTLFDTGDSDDEILSQLDVDAIAASYHE